MGQGPLFGFDGGARSVRVSVMIETNTGAKARFVWLQEFKTAVKGPKGERVKIVDYRMSKRLGKFG